jgi:hypothetical protein
MQNVSWDDGAGALIFAIGNRSQSIHGSEWRPEQEAWLSDAGELTIAELECVMRIANAGIENSTRDDIRSWTTDGEPVIELSFRREVSTELRSMLPKSIRAEWMEPNLTTAEYYSLQSDAGLEVGMDVSLFAIADARELRVAIDPLLQAFPGLSLKAIADQGRWDGLPDVSVRIVPAAEVKVVDIGQFALAVRSIAFGGFPGGNGDPSSHLASIITSQGISLLGQAESETLDAKRELYDLANQAGRHSLAVDVAAFANSSGGLIAIGATTTRNRHGKDVISSVGGIPPATQPNLSQMGKSVENSIVPAIQGLDLRVIETRKSSLVLIIVPRQEETAKPFIVKGVQFASDKTSGAGFTIATRRRDDNVNMSVEELHSLISAGRLALRSFRSSE